jgi:hypothetical protein
MARPATLFGVEEDAADSRFVIESGALFKRIAQKRSPDFGSSATVGNNRSSIRLRFSSFQPIRIPVGQQHRVRDKRKRRRAYLERKKTARRASAAQSVSGKQRTKKEPAAEEQIGTPVP